MSWSIRSAEVDVSPSLPQVGSHPRNVAALCLLTAVLLGPLVVMNVPCIATDYDFHIDLARRMAETGRLETPHFLFQIAVIAVKRVVPFLDFIDASRLVAWSCYLATNLIVFYWLADSWRRRTLRTATMPHSEYRLTENSLAPVVLTLTLCLATPISFLTWWNFYLGYLSPTPHHSPTYVMLRPLALLVFIATVQAFAAVELGRRERLRLLGTGIVLVLSALAKPNFAIIFLPALAAVGLAECWSKRSLRPAAIATLIALPAIGVLAWQFRFAFLHPAEPGVKAGVAFAPFQLIASHTKPGWIVPKFLLSIAFPLTFLLAFPRSLSNSFSLRMAWLIFGGGCFLAYGCIETGPRQLHGNFLWSAHIGLFLLFVATGRELVVECVGKSWRTWLPWGVLTLHAICGLVYLAGFATGYAPGKWL